MTATIGKTVRDLALEIPNATRVFEKWGIDYCCGGMKSLEQACEERNVSLDEVVSSLDEAAKVPAQPARAWWSAALSELIAHIIETHHKFTREEIVRLNALLEKVCGVHGKNHPELFQIRETFRALAQELSTHLMKEEMVLFPYILRMEESVLQREPVLPAPFGKVDNPVHMMMMEHDSAGSALKAMREASHGYTAPADACVSYRTLYQALEGFEADLHQHIHLENNVLFPRAISLEQGK
ncbi:MAG TPA: iron-sulfur cluster repair di-iron protein [Terriglobales bacterium]|nr:iron-sulfur cluster repair di-iron protein [Terriglobales bacterium]